MDNYRAWFKAKTDTFKGNYCQMVDNYFDLVLRQIEAFTSRTGDESPQELSRMMRHMEDTNTLYQQQLDGLSSRYFAGKATFSSVSNIINESTSLTNQQQQINGITKDSGIVRIDHQLSDNQFGVQFMEESTEEDKNPNTENSNKLSSTELDPKCNCKDCQADAIRVQAEGDLVVATKFGNSTVDTSPSGDSLHPIEVDSESESESDTEVTKVKSTGGRAQSQPSQGYSVPTSLKLASASRPSSAGTSILASHGNRKRTLFSSGSGTLTIDVKRLRGVLQGVIRPLPSHTCSVCELSFPSETLLEAHELMEHSQQQQQEEPPPIRPFACELCDKTYTQKAHLSSHMLVHSGLKMARCTWPDCSYDSVFQANVITHIRMVHFKLPQTKKKQSELNIVDDRDPNEYLEKIHNGLTGN